MAEAKGCGVAEVRPKAEEIELVSGLPAKEKHERLRAACRHTDVGHRIMAFYLAEMDERREYQLLSCSSTIHYAVTELGLDRTSAWELIRAGRKLCDLGRIDAAFCYARMIHEDGPRQSKRVRFRPPGPESRASPYQRGFSEPRRGRARSRLYGVSRRRALTKSRPEKTAEPARHS